jgi:acyl-CoA thioesterase I
VVRRFRSSLITPGLLLLACGEPGTLGSTSAPSTLVSAAPGVFEQPPAPAPPGNDGEGGNAGEVSERPPLVGTPVGLGGAGPIDETPDNSAPGSDGSGVVPDAGAPAASSTDGGAAVPDPREASGPGADAGTGEDTSVSTTPGGSGAPGTKGVTNRDAGTPSALLPSDFTLAIVGSSTAAGDGASTQANAWAAQLEVSLAARLEGGVALHNFASGGFTSAELAPGSGHPGSVDAALAIEPDLILVALAGSNDLSEGTTGPELISRLTLLRDTAIAARVPVFFLSTAPKDLTATERETLAAWALDMGQSFGSCPVPDRSTGHSPCFIDVFAALADDSLGLAAAYDSGDGIHINDAGHAVIYALVQNIVEPFVCSRARCR